MAEKNILIPADVPKKHHETYIQNYTLLTHGTHRLFLFAGDQKLEHLHADFFGPTIALEDNNPKHMFDIASNSSIGAFATHLGLVALYGKEYPTMPYIIKLNGKTNLIPLEKKDPCSSLLWSVDDVIKFKNESGLSITGVGYTLYLGSIYEEKMLAQTAQVIYQAHQHGLIAILWVYPRGIFINNPAQRELIAGAAGVAASLGADFVKLNPPAGSNEEVLKWLALASQTAGKTKIILSCGKKIDEQLLLEAVYNRLHHGGISGIAIGRNLHQRNLTEAVGLANRLADLIYKNKNLEEV